METNTQIYLTGTGNPNNVWLMKSELTLKPSQWINTGWIMFGLLGIPLVIPPLIAIYKIIEVSCHRYDFYEDHVLETKGVFNRVTNEVRYFRVKSIQLEEPLLYRIFGLSTLRIKSSDWYSPNLSIVAITIGPILMKDINRVVKVERKEHGVKEYDI
jgi:uncharacterized membrane protein YdbT with pleckstrin-like domain